MKTIIHTVFRIAVIGFILTNTCLATENEMSGNIYGRLTALQCDSLIKANESNPNFVILDVRTPGEWSGGHIKGSINRSTGLVDFTTQLDVLPKQKMFLMHCQSGGRSAGAFIKMKDLGFAEVYEMIGGLNSWNSAKLPTTTLSAPKLMLAGYVKSNSMGTNDTVKITVTNRANGVLTFSSATFNDVHSISNTFNKNTTLEGAADYTFTIIHSEKYTLNDTTKIRFESNGGNIGVRIAFKSDVIQEILASKINDMVLYPNPAANRLYISTCQNENFGRVSVRNLVGKTVLLSNNLNGSQGIDISELPNGIYIAKFETDGQIISRKFMVKH